MSAQYLYEHEPVQDIHTKQIGRVEYIQNDATLRIRWLDGTMSLMRLSDLVLAPGYRRRGRRTNRK
jgi:hypothetical protein